MPDEILKLNNSQIRKEIFCLKVTNRKVRQRNETEGVHAKNQAISKIRKYLRRGEEDAEFEMQP